MNPRTLCKQFAEDMERERLVDVIYDEMAAYCQEKNISTDEMSNDELEELAEGFVTRGLSFEGLGSEKRWRNAEMDTGEESDAAIDLTQGRNQNWLNGEPDTSHKPLFDLSDEEREERMERIKEIHKEVTGDPDYER